MMLIVVSTAQLGHSEGAIAGGGKPVDSSGLLETGTGWRSISGALMSVADSTISTVSFWVVSYFKVHTSQFSGKRFKLNLDSNR